MSELDQLDIVEVLPQRPFGRAKETVSMLGLGGSHIGKNTVRDSEAIYIIRAAIDSGMTFLDNSWDYNEGRSETLMGKALQDGYRNKAFLMTKIDGRTREAAQAQLHESLQRLRVDAVDLLQHHEVIRFEDVDRIFAEGGAMEALIEARQQGKTRYIGFTGHKDPAIHLYMLQQASAKGFEFDSVQMPLNPMDAHYRSFETQVLPVALRHRIAVLGMKSLASGVLLKSGKVTAEECVRYVLSLPIATLIAGIESRERLAELLRLCKYFRPMSADERTELLQRTKEAALDGQFELFKTTAHFDSTTQNPQWLGEDSARTIELVSN